MNSTAPRTQADILASLAWMEIRDMADAENLLRRGLLLDEEFAAYKARQPIHGCPCAICNHS